MFATHATAPKPMDTWTWIRRAAVGLAVAIAVVASGVPVAADARAATLDSYRLGPDRETCLTIVACGPGTLPPGKVDPGPPRRQADLPTPSAVVTRLGAVGTRSGQVRRLDIEVTNWKAYHETLFVSGRQYPACDAVGNRFRTWVDILDGTDGRVLFRYCVIGSPLALPKLFHFVSDGDPIPERIAVRIIDNATDRVVVSPPVSVPPMSRVTTSYTDAEQANLAAAAQFWDIPVRKVQKAGVMAIRYINGVAGTTGSRPLRPRPSMGGPVNYYSDWTADDWHALEWVSDYHDLTYAESQKLGAAVMIYVAAVAQQ